MRRVFCMLALAAAALAGDGASYYGHWCGSAELPAFCVARRNATLHSGAVGNAW